MPFARPTIAASSRPFGRGPRWQVETAAPVAAARFGDDLKLFATTFLAGFLFVSVLIG